MTKLRNQLQQSSKPSPVQSKAAATLSLSQSFTSFAATTAGGAAAPGLAQAPLSCSSSTSTSVDLLKDSEQIRCRRPASSPTAVTATATTTTRSRTNSHNNIHEYDYNTDDDDESIFLLADDCNNDTDGNNSFYDNDKPCSSSSPYTSCSDCNSNNPRVQRRNMLLLLVFLTVFIGILVSMSTTSLLSLSSSPSTTNSFTAAAGGTGEIAVNFKDELLLNHRKLTTEKRHYQHEHQNRKHRGGGGGESGLVQPRILYIVTTLAEYNTGTRATVRGSDRLQETLIPVVAEGIKSMIHEGYDVDLFLVCHFILTEERQELVQQALPHGVGLQVWNDATPLGYDTSKDPFTTLQNRTLHLSRQHRFVIKDKLLHYDLFVNFEDDMLITGEHVNHFVRLSNEIDRLREAAPETLPEEAEISSNKDALDSYHGTMTRAQLKRTIPGFIRVEVLLDEAHYPAQSNTGPVPIDMDFVDDSSSSSSQSTVDPTVCCHLKHHETFSANRPKAPTADQLMLWETNVLPLGVRKMPQGSWLNWVLMQRGPNQRDLSVNEIIGDYWSNRPHETSSADSTNEQYYGKVVRPQPHEFKYINNQGGWMATKAQLIRWHTEICPGSFLPPYDDPHYRFDGLDMRNVEWYSGAMQLSTVRHACNMQRIIALEPHEFSKSLIYHTANNKQRQLAEERGKRESFVKANTLLGQLNTVKKNAEREMKKQLLSKEQQQQQMR